MTNLTQTPTTIDENIQTIVRRDHQKQDKKSCLEMIASAIADFSGTVKFAIINACIFVAWIAFNVTPLAYDPYPFTFLTLMVSLESIFLSVFLLISQRAIEDSNQDRHHLDLQINLLAERETTEILKLLNLVAEKIGLSETDRIRVTELEADTNVEEVLDKIERSKEVK